MSEILLKFLKKSFLLIFQQKLINMNKGLHSKNKIAKSNIEKFD